MGVRFYLWILAAVFAPAVLFASPQDHPPVVPSPPPEAAGLNRSLLRFIEDDAPVRGERENRDEALAFDAVVSYARRVSETSFRMAARHDLTFVHLLGKEAGKYRGEIVEVQGRLVRNLDVGPTAALKAEGIEHLYEAYIKSEKHPGYAWCVFHTEQSPQLPVGEDLNVPVTFRGYFFKVFAYREQGKAYRVPLLIGRGVEPRTVAPLPASLVDAAFMSIPMLIVMLVAAVALMLGLVLWFRVSDQRTQRMIQHVRGSSEAAPEPAVFHDADTYEGTPSLKQNE
jgi:hypothetical protein